MQRQDLIAYYLDNFSGYRSHFNTRCKWSVRYTWISESFLFKNNNNSNNRFNFSFS